MDRLLLVSSDCHVGIPTKAHVPYLDSKYRRDFEDFDQWAAGGSVDNKTYFEKPRNF